MNNPPFFRKPLVQTSIGILVFMAIYLILTFFPGDWRTHLVSLKIDAILILLLLLLWFVFFAQFVLPVRNLSDRAKLLERMINYYMPLLNLRGPAIFIKDGKIIQETMERGGEVKEEIRRTGKGVVWLDTASAAVLRTPVKFTRAVGPGVVFTGRGESIAGVVDLHHQSHSVGPNDKEEPFASKPEDKSDENFKEIQDRIRWATSGQTRDGIEIVAGISVVFKIDTDEENHEGGTYFGYNENAVFKAIANEGINPSAGREDKRFKVRWNELPAPVAVDVWREYLRKFTLSQLFEPLSVSANTKNTGDNQTALQFIIDMINERLIQPLATVLNDVGQPTGQKKPSREYQLLKDSGIKVFKVNIRRLCFAQGIEEQLVRQWTANWLDTARREREYVEQKRSLANLAGQEDARKEFAVQASQELAKNPTSDSKKALDVLLQDTLKGVIRNTSLYRRMGSEPREITEVIQWLREKA